MSLFPSSLYDDDVSFAPVFRFIDAFDNWNSRTGGKSSSSQLPQIRSTFNPKFDVVETPKSYELHGELAGLTKDQVSIEWTDSQTLSVHGRVERKYTSGTPPAGLVEGSQPAAAGAITEGGDKSPVSESHRATVADEETELARERGTPPEESNKQVASPSGKDVSRPVPSKAQKFWCQERSIGEFHRTFTFPARVDESAVTANLENGILHITIPKQEKRLSRRVEIS